MEKKNLRIFSVLILTVVVAQLQLHAQCAPNCRDINASVIYDLNSEEFHAKIFWEDVVTNYEDCAAPVDYAFFSRGGSPINQEDEVENEDYVLFSVVCDYLTGVDMVLSNDLGECTSRITFKTGIPVILGRSVDVYCNDSIITDPAILINDLLPTTIIPCDYGTVVPRFVADWIDAYECDPMSDTVKVIYREWEAFGKNGQRGVGVDTIVVRSLPDISLLNTYCVERDSIYCGSIDEKFGPYMVYPEDPNGLLDLDGDQSLCDTIYFLEWDFGANGLTVSPAYLDAKCDIDIHVDAWEYENHCSPQYKIVLEIKETCPALTMSQPVCTVPFLGNALERVGPGYWRCEFWIIDYDTVPPIAEVKYDKLQDQNIAWPEYCENQEQHGDGDPIHCYPTPIYPGSGYDAPVVIVPASSHDCAAHTYIPPLCVYDDWSGVKQVKARIDGIGTWVLEGTGEECDELDTDDLYCEDHDYDVAGYCYESHQTIKLPKSELPYRVTYEIYDYCHNIDTVYSYILVKDQTKPVAVADKGVTVSLSDKKVWVDAYTFDEGSWDNCGVNFILARRTDWYEACLDLCKNYDEEGEEVSAITACWSGEHGDTLYFPHLEEDKHLDEVEAHYVKTLEWLCYDGVPCGDLVYNAWLYDLMKYATLHCVDHPYEVDNKYFRHLFEQFYAGNGTYYDCDSSEAVEFCIEKFKIIYPYFDPGCEFTAHNGFMTQPVGGTAGLVAAGYELSAAELGLIDKYEQIGGGWSKEVPFDCADACGPVTVEILVMDYWCNWSKAWTDVWVEDKTPVTVGKDVVEELEITCATYKEARYGYGDEVHKVSLEYLVNAAKEGDEIAYDSLDAILGGYCKAWKDPYGNYVDIDGEEIDCDIDFYDKRCYCKEIDTSIRVYDEHFGYIWKDSAYTKCYYDDVHQDLYKGIVVVNCEENVYCEQDIWCEFDHCGQGYIFRKFKIWQGCPPQEGYGSSHTPDTIYRHQRIWVGNQCELDKYMFDVPYDQTVYSCGIEYDADGSGNVSGAADPEFTGYPEYKFDDDCRIVGIAYEDKVFKIVGGDEGCYKIVRTWYFADWCEGKPVEKKWWKKDKGYTDYCVQKILVVDTIPPVCTITGPVDEGGTIEAGGCDYTFNASVNITDVCGVIEYSWQLKEIKGSEAEIFQEGYGELNGDSTDQVDISIKDLVTGSYKLVAVITDECQNESYCEYNFDVVTGKKPAAICLTSLTVTLNPWDTNGDGTIDTAIGTVWADEFNQSSTPPCDSEEELEFYIELLGDGMGDADSFDMTYLEDYLEVGCDQLGSDQMVRMWVVAGEGSADFCDVILKFNANDEICVTEGSVDTIIGETGSLVGEILDENGITVEHVNVIAESNEAFASLSSGEDGSYNITATMGSIVTLTPEKDIFPMNGVSTQDIVKLLKHIGGSELLPTKYRYLAADVNRDGFINVLDVNDIRNLILGNTDRFPRSQSWRFLLSDYEFQTDNPAGETIPMRLTLNVDETNMRRDFIGVKMGDVTMDNDPAQRAPRSGNEVVLVAEDAQLQPGESIEVSLRLRDAKALAGMQFTLQWLNEMIEISPSFGDETVAGEEHMGVRVLDDGYLLTSWTSDDGTDQDLAGDMGVISFSVKAKVALRLSDVIAINSSMLSPEAYAGIEVHPVSLQFEGEVDKPDFEFKLEQNYPNPFRASTRIRYWLPTSDDVQITVQDVSGKSVFIQQQFSDAGWNEWILDRSGIEAPGIYMYRLETSKGTATRKMLVTQ